MQISLLFVTFNLFYLSVQPISTRFSLVVQNQTFFATFLYKEALHEFICTSTNIKSLRRFVEKNIIILFSEQNIPIKCRFRTIFEVYFCLNCNNCTKVALNDDKLTEFDYSLL